MLLLLPQHLAMDLGTRREVSKLARATSIHAAM